MTCKNIRCSKGGRGVSSVGLFVLHEAEAAEANTPKAG